MSLADGDEGAGQQDQWWDAQWWLDFDTNEWWWRPHDSEEWEKQVNRDATYLSVLMDMCYICHVVVLAIA